MRTRTAGFWLCALAFLGLAYAPSVQADPGWIIAEPSEETRFTELTFGTSVDGREGFGLMPGVALGVPIIDSGMIPPINDALFIEAGLFVGPRIHRTRPNHVWVIPEAGPRWNFYLTPNWDAFASIKFGWAIGRHGDFWVRGTVGTCWWFLPQLALRAEFAGAAVVGGQGYLGLSYRFL